MPRSDSGGEEPEEQSKENPNEPLLVALQGAVADGEQASAERILKRLSERELDARDQELLAGFRKVLTGRAMVRNLEVGLLLRKDEQGRRLYLRLATQGPQDLTLVFPPLTLDSVCLSLGVKGEINRSMTSQLMHPLAEFELKAGESYEVFLGDCPSRLPKGALAVRDAWRVTIRSGHLRTELGTYPAERMPRAELVADTQSEDLLDEVEEPAIFAAALEQVLTGDGEGRGELLARAARLDPARRAELLPLLAKVLAETPKATDARSKRLAGAVVPSLRWISPSASVLANLPAWEQWLTAWQQRNTQHHRDKNRSGLVLP